LHYIAAFLTLLPPQRSAREYVSLRLCVYVSVCQQNISNSNFQRILMKFFGDMGCVTSHRKLDFDGLPDHDADTGIL